MSDNNNNNPAHYDTHHKVIEHDLRLNSHDRRMDQMEGVIDTLSGNIRDLKKQIMIIGYGMMFILGGTSDVGVNIATKLLSGLVG